MAITIRLATQLRAHVQGREEVTAVGETVRAVLDDVDRQYPGFKDQVLGEKGVKRHLNVFVNEDDIRFLESLDTALRDRDVLTIMAAVAGG
ncbi:MAG: MoaD/ThiS family protein [Deltaproteobacteria bacterium]|nr:MoaD/ThiS family protein [Deltaproteobacteria bacterium]